MTEDYPRFPDIYGLYLTQGDKDKIMVSQLKLYMIIYKDQICIIIYDRASQH
jgi:hypothetical protein